MDKKKDEQNGIPQGAQILARQLQGNVLLCSEKKDGKIVNFLFFPKRNAHMWVTLEKMKEIVQGFDELLKYKGKKNE